MLPSFSSAIQLEPTAEQMENRLIFYETIKPRTFGEKVFAYARKYGLTNKDVDNALEIIRCESRFKPEALNTNKDKSKDFSWWQINNKRWKEHLQGKGLDITNPDDNLEAGFYLYATYGVRLWKPSIKCHGIAMK